MNLLSRLLGADRSVERVRPLYARAVETARESHWYLDGAVPDTVDGRFDMVAAVLSLVLVRLERDPAAAEASARLVELFVEDMDGQLRQIGIGDVVVGKHIGKMMGALGGRLGVYRDGLAAGDLGPALRRNLYREAPVSDAAVAHVDGRLMALAGDLASVDTAAILDGRWPR